MDARSILINIYKVPEHLVAALEARAWKEGASRGLRMTQSMTKYDLLANNPYEDQ